ncbi:MAG: IPT/TIG domain-containing protein [Phycisphaerae bacterium]|nr:IPT/TIG domain-containing protein [Phycisphaerae bacterium]
MLQRTPHRFARRAVFLIATALICSGCPSDSDGTAGLGGIGNLFQQALTPPIRVDSIAPDKGSVAGGTKVTIVGDGFPADATVLFGEFAATQVAVLNSRVIEAIAPAGAAGSISITITAGNGRRLTLPAAFEYVDAPDPDPAATSITPAIGPAGAATSVTILGSNFKAGTQVIFGGLLATQTTLLTDTLLTAITPSSPAGKVDVLIVAPGRPTVVLPQAFEFIAAATTPIATDTTAPRVVGAVALSNTGVRISFSEPIRAGAELASNYQIRGTETAYLTVSSARLLPDNPSVVELTTLSQAADTYVVRVVNVADVAGNPLAAPDGLSSLPGSIQPSEARFAGIAPGSSAEQIDSDGDGFADWFEMTGWNISVTTVNGNRSTYRVTSDPFNPDTDGDGFTDAEENANGFDPRTSDTDADLLDDVTEFNLWFSNPNDQDTDNDGFSDYLEVTFFKTSPVLADTDGDQWTDDDEIVNRNRNPRLSDVPIPQIRVGEIGLFIKETYSYTDEQGTERSQSFERSTGFSQSSSRTFSTSDTRGNEASDQFSQGIEAGYESLSPKVVASVGFEQTRQRSYSSTISQESAEESSEEHNESRAFGSSFSENRAFSRTIDEARLNMDVTISNASNVAFTLTDVELSAFVRDPVRRVDVPLGTLLSEREINGGSAQEYNLGPFDLDRGPFIFRDIQIFPNVAEQLRKNPRAVTVKIANFNIRDESGRLFAFSSQDINDRTAGLVLDFGNGDVESYRVATANIFDDEGRQSGITMRTALEQIIGISRFEGEDTTPPNAPITDEIRNSYGVNTNNNGVRVLTRIRGVKTPVGTVNTQRRVWAVVSPEPISDAVDFDDIVLRAGRNYALLFVADRDGDGLFANVEFLYGSSDDNADTDGDGIGDFDEVRTGWVVEVPGNPSRAFSDPLRVDSDSDGISDIDERALATDPRSKDTDEDGLSDAQELSGYEIALFDGDDDDTNNPVFNASPYTAPRIVAGANGICNTVATGDDQQLVNLNQAPTGGAAGAVIGPGPNGVIDSTPAGDDRRQVAHDQSWASDPLRRDTDADGLPDGREQFLGSLPGDPLDAGTVVDTDLDGLVDFTEITGWTITVNGASRQVTSNPLEPDTDGDGLPDLLERIYRMDPSRRDTDGDTLADRQELDAADPAGYFPIGVEAEFTSRCADATSCMYTAPTSPLGTNPLRADTDADGRADNVELTVPIIVSVFGQAPYQVLSDPKLANVDADGWNDGQEAAAGTDPTVADTDMDTTSDSVEASRGRNPLRPDKRVTFTYTNINIIGDCDSGSDGGDFEGPLNLSYPGNTGEQLFDMDNVCDSTPEGGFCTVNVSRTFILNDGQSFRAFGGPIKEVDSGSADEQLGSYDQTYSFATVPNSDSWNLPLDSGCNITINASISVD